MNNKKIVIGIILIVSMIYLSGCVEKTSPMTGTYVCAACNGVLDLYDDQWEISGKDHSYGNYTVRHDEVRLKLEGIGIFVPLKIDGKDLIDPDGDRWVRE